MIVKLTIKLAGPSITTGRPEPNRLDKKRIGLGSNFSTSRVFRKAEARFLFGEDAVAKLIALGVLAFCGGLMFAAGFILIFMR